MGGVDPQACRITLGGMGFPSKCFEIKVVHSSVVTTDTSNYRIASLVDYKTTVITAAIMLTIYDLCVSSPTSLELSRSSHIAQESVASFGGVM